MVMLKGDIYGDGEGILYRYIYFELGNARMSSLPPFFKYGVPGILPGYGYQVR